MGLTAVVRFSDHTSDDRAELIRGGLACHGAGEAVGRRVYRYTFTREGAIAKARSSLDYWQSEGWLSWKVIC